MSSELRYPVWTLFNTELTSLPFPQGVATITRSESGRGDRALMIFGTQDLAKKFLEAIQKPRLTPFALEYPQQILDVIDYCEREGVTTVAIDFEFDEKGKPPKGTAASLSNFRIALRKSVKFAPPSVN
ncbi:hypothetical protein [Fimbriiglobus ruber]|uniref:hypothetical protein n=1 Tax=Fimbriiglobus ruber TaxID=1908690 RepID=UPI00117ABD05|nr:hypothetical protein [Fimbriiglobus ruber]